MTLAAKSASARSLDAGTEFPGAALPITTSGPRRRERSGESGLRWGSFALRVRRDACPMLLHRAAQRSYPQGK